MNRRKPIAYLCQILTILISLNLFILTANAEKEFDSMRPITKGEILKSLAAAKKSQDRINKLHQQRPTLTEEQNRQVEQEVSAILFVKKALSGSGNIVINKQSPGKTIFINEVKMENPGFISIEDPRNATSLGASRLLSGGFHKNIIIPLTEYVDGAELMARLYEDDGDKILNTKKDQYMPDDKEQPIYKSFEVTSRRNLRYAYYSNDMKHCSALVLREQLPGRKITFDSISMPFDRKNPRQKFHIAIFKDKNGLPGKLISYTKQRSGGGQEVLLTEPVSDEMLYAMIFKDNGDNKFDQVSDYPVRGDGNLAIIVKFKVIK